MNDDEIDQAVIAEYQRTYEDWEHPVKVTQKVRGAFDGTLAVIKATNGEGKDESEMCFVFENGKYEVQIFESTEQLAIFLESRATMPWYQRFFGTSTLSGIVFLLTLVMIFVSGFFHDFSDKGFAVLGAVVGAAAGFYFRSAR